MLYRSCQNTNLFMGIRKIFPSFLIKIYHFSLALLGAVLYNFPSRKLIVIGVTGTNGKTTVVDMITSILEEAGFKVASSSSIKFKICDKERKNFLKMTMPGRLKLQHFLWQAVRHQCRYAVIEVTSEGILQYRHKFIDFDIAVLTNISPEHIERHGGFQNYIKAKSQLFSQVHRNLRKKGVKKVIVLNADDENLKNFISFPADEKWLYSLKDEIKNNFLENQNIKLVKAQIIENNHVSSSFSVDGHLLKVGLPGRFNIYNALAATCVGLSQGISLDVINKALSQIDQIPGRLETIISRPFKVIVDYAHNPAALKSLYETLEKSKTQEGHLICVLGACGGGRDKWKRPVLGKIASHYCNKIILANEDPYEEDPNTIINQIKEGIDKTNFLKSNFFRILDRREAIRKALSLAQPNDIVVISGKGSEPWMCVAHNKKIPWDDREIVRKEFFKIERTSKQKS